MNATEAVEEVARLIDPKAWEPLPEGESDKVGKRIAERRNESFKAATAVTNLFIARLRSGYVAPGNAAKPMISAERARKIVEALGGAPVPTRPTT
jgi:hypothetical protein